MRIAYVCYWNAYAQDGVTTKINTHSSAWRAAGHQVEVFCLSPSGPPGRAQSLDAEVFAFGSPAGRPAATSRVLRAARRSGADAVYLRFDHFLPTAGQLMRRVPTVVEINGSESHFRATKGLAYRAYSHLNEQVVHRGARGFVAVSHHEARVLERSGKPVEVVGNGVDLDVRVTTPAPKSDRLRFVLMVGARTPWHGVDKVLTLARRMPDCDFTLIGVEPGHLGSPLPTNVDMHGLMSRTHYEPLLAQADVALGPLAMDRVDRFEISSLKVPEYLAYGLPVIVGYQETDFVGRDPWYLLRIPTTADNIETHGSEIRAFAERVKGRRVQRDEIASIVGARAKEAQRLAFIARVTGH